MCGGWGWGEVAESLSQNFEQRRTIRINTGSVYKVQSGDAKLCSLHAGFLLDYSASLCAAVGVRVFWGLFLLMCMYVIFFLCLFVCVYVFMIVLNISVFYSVCVCVRACVCAC